MIKEILIVCFLGTVAINISKAGNDTSCYKKTNLIFEANYGISKLMTSYTSLYESPAHFIELRTAKQTLGDKKWQSEFGYPEVGVSFVFAELGNNEVLGQAYGIVPDISFNTLPDKPFSIKITLGTGLAVFSKFYNEKTNPENTYIGSRIANMTIASFTLQRILSKNIIIQYGINYHHCSNGHYQVPNVGMNFPGFKVGIKYYPDGKRYPEKEEKNIRTKSAWRFNSDIGIGIHEFAGPVRPVGGPKYFISTINTGAYKSFNNILNIKIGLSLKYYNDYYNNSIKYKFYDEKIFLRSLVVSPYLGNEFLLYKTGIYFQTGLDIYAPFEKKYLKYKKKELDLSKYLEEFVSSEIGINYYFFNTEKRKIKNPYIGIFLKTNLGTADFIGTHLGLLF